MSKYQTQPKPGVNDSRGSVRHPSKLIRVIKKKVKPSPFNFSEIPGAPHPMPNDYIKRLPRFSGNNPIEGYLDIFWLYMESWCAKDEDVYMHALGASLDGDAKLWFDHLEPVSIIGCDMFTDF